MNDNNINKTKQKNKKAKYKVFFLTVLFTKQGIYVHLTIRKKITDGKKIR